MFPVLHTNFKIFFCSRSAKKPLVQKYTCTSMFIAALFTIAETWNLKSIGRGIDKEGVLHAYNGKKTK